MTTSEVVFSMSGTRVTVTPSVPGHNAYDPLTGNLFLDKEIWNSRSSRSLSIVAHECGHSQQSAKLYMVMIVFFQVSLVVLFILMMTALFAFHGFTLCLGFAGGLVASFLASKLMVLAFEFDASRRAFYWLRRSGRVNMKIARKVLTDSFLTYLNIR